MHGTAPTRTTWMPERRALGLGELDALESVLMHYIVRGEDPGYQGEFEQRYTDAFCAQMGGGYADAVATGTAALYVAIAALNLPKGSEVIVSPITDPGTLSAIVLNGLKPRIADSERDSFNIDVVSISNSALRATSRDVSAIMAVHSLGQPISDIADIVKMAHSNGVKVIEDCSQSHGATINGKPVGTFGDIAAFSTMYRKAHATGGSGGVVYTRDLHLHQMALAHADRGKPRWLDGFDDRDPTQFLFPALNLHTDEISCAIGLASLRRLPETIGKRQEFIAELTARMYAGRTICTQDHLVTAGDSPFVVPITVDPARISCSKTEFAEAVRAEGIPLNPHYKYLVADWPWLFPTPDTPNARDMRDRSWMLYLNENYGPQEAEDIVDAIVKVEKRFAA